MATPEQIQVVAASMNAHRPDWPVSSLVTFLSRHHAHRSYRALSIAGTAVATDPTTTTPNLLNNTGPWWSAAAVVVPDAASTTVPGAGMARCEVPGHEHELAGHCRACRAEQIGRTDEDAPATTLGITPEQAARNAAWAARCKDQLDPRQKAAGEREDVTG